MEAFTNTAEMKQRWVDNGERPPYTWKDIIGMVLLDHKNSGNNEGLSFTEFLEALPRKFTFYNVPIIKGGHKLTMQRALRLAEDFFIKRGKDLDDRGLEKKLANDKWVIREGKEDCFINPRRNTTGRAVAKGAGANGAQKRKLKEQKEMEERLETGVEEEEEDEEVVEWASKRSKRARK
jgi:hypothetical protein